MRPLIQNQKQIETKEQLKNGTNRLDIRVAKASEYPWNINRDITYKCSFFLSIDLF